METPISKYEEILALVKRHLEGVANVLKNRNLDDLCSHCDFDYFVEAAESNGKLELCEELQKIIKHNEMILGVDVT